MPKKRISDVVSATGLVAHFVTELVREIKLRGGDDEQIHHLMSRHELIMKVADVAVEPPAEGNFRTMLIELTPYGGMRADDCIIEAVELARRKKCTVRFNLNSLPIEVGPDSVASDVHRDWYQQNRALRARTA